MINHYRLMTLGAAALMTAAAFCAAPGNRVFYGFTLGSAEFADDTKEYDFGFVSYPFDPTASEAEIYGEILNSYYDDPTTGVFAAAGIDGMIYACEYQTSGIMTSPVPGNLVVFNTFNGLKETIGPWNPDNTSFKPQDMTWSEKDQKMYAIGFENSQSGLYELDLKTARFKRVAVIPNGSATIAADPAGTLYTLNTSGTLFTLNPRTGKATKVMETMLSGMFTGQSMEFDRASGLLYWVSSTNGHPQGYENSWLEEIDPRNKTIREIGQVGIGARFLGMHIPSAENLLAPAAPTNVKGEYAPDGSLSATITFNAPETTLNGDKEIGTLYGYRIERDGKEVKLGTSADGDLTPGAEISFTDNDIPETGYYRYDVYFINGKGNGAKGTAFTFIGPDAPGAVTAIKAVPADGMGSLTLSWNAPEAGQHLGAYDPKEVKYTVTRNDNIVVAKDITDTSVVDDDFLRVSKYSYTITASNAQGSSDAVSAGVIAGPAMELPFEQTFENDAQVQNLWTSVDANNDGISWMFSTTLGQGAFGDFESAAEYIVSPGLGNSDNGHADEWLLSPPMLFEAGQEYELTISSRSYSKDQMDLYLGKTNTVDGMTEKFGNLEIEHDMENPDIDETVGTVAFRRRSVAIPAFSEDAVRSVGIHLITEHLTHGFLQINGIYVGEKGLYNSGINDIEAAGPDLNFSVQGGNIVVFGAFDNAELYSLSGSKILSTSSAIIPVDGLAKGVYILNIDGRGFKLAL